MKLHLTLRKKWFDMILRGEKKEEYREIKPYWERRLVFQYESYSGKARSTLYPSMTMIGFNGFTEVEFKNGYGVNAPTMTVELRGIEVGMSKAEWNDEGETNCYVLKLGNVTFHKNCNP